MLFRPFDLSKWFTLGFCCFLAILDQGGFNANCQVPDFSGFGGGTTAPAPPGPPVPMPTPTPTPIPPTPDEPNITVDPDTGSITVIAPGAPDAPNITTDPDTGDITVIAPDGTTTTISGSNDKELKQVLQWLEDHLGLVIGIGAAVLILIIGMTALLQWLGSRGKFMFLEPRPGGASLG